MNNFDIGAMWAHMGIINKGVTIALLLMGVMFTVILIERLFVMSSLRSRSRKFSAEVAPLIDANKFGEALKLADEHRTKSDVAQLTHALLTAFLRKREGGVLTPYDRAEQELGLFEEAFGRQIRRGLNVIATTASIAPFVGLLGTVVGIIVAFQAIGKAGNAGMSTVMVGIAEALVETALGLMVAIPAVIAFNYISGKIDGFESDLQHKGKRLLGLLKDVK